MAGKKRRSRVSMGTLFMLLFTAAVILACALFIVSIAGNDVYERTSDYIRMLSYEGVFDNPMNLRVTPAPTQQIVFFEDTPTPAPQRTPTPVPGKSTITIAAGGTIYAPKAVRESAKEGRRYDFTAAFEGVNGVLSAADLAIVTLETAAAGESVGFDNYNAPSELLDSLWACGVDLVALATERALDKGYKGLDLTISELTSRGLAYAGVHADSNKRSHTTMMRIGGVQVAVLSYTYGLSENGQKMTQNDSRGMIAMIENNAMVQDVMQARVQGANLVIVLPHWGTKNKSDTADTLRRLAGQLAEAGADLILGTHPNVTQATERLRVKRADGLEYETVVCYSLGSLMTDARTDENTAGMIAQIDATYDPVTRRMHLGQLECVPVYIASQLEDGKTVYRAVEAHDAEALSLLTNDERAKAQQAAQSVSEAAKPIQPKTKTDSVLSGGHG